MDNFLSSGSNPTPSEELAVHLSDAGWQVITASRARSRFLKLLDMVLTAFQKRDEYSIAHISVFSGLAFIWAETVAWVLKRLKKPYVLTLRGGALPEFSARWPARVTRLLRSAAIVTAPSDYLVEQMRKNKPDIRLLPNPIELSRYSFRLRFIPKPRLVWLRAFHKVYQPELAPQVIALLTEEFPNVQLTMIGPDKDGSLTKTKEMAAVQRVNERVRFVGGISKKEVPVYLEQADIFLNTTSIDNTPVSVLEAMACGLCVVSTNVGGIPYLLEHEKDALLVPAGDAQTMADAVRKILKEPGLAEKLSSGARQKAEQFDWTKVLPQWEKLFEEVLETKHP